MQDRPIYEKEKLADEPDPDETPIKDRKLVTQPYDLVISSLIDLINRDKLYLRPLSKRPKFQRGYVWPPSLASKLIESILLNVPIPPCYLSQNEDFNMDVIDGQQRIYSIYRFFENQFRLSNLEVLPDLNGSRFFELSKQEQSKITNYTLRCVVITNDSHPEIKFDVFQRLNTNTVPLNAQELRNCIYRGNLNDLLGKLATYDPWLKILRRKEPDKRMRDEELILRFFAFNLKGVNSYQTPQKHWLNGMAKDGQTFSERKIDHLETVWKTTIDNCLIIFKPEECFRRLPLDNKSKVINRALMDLTMNALEGLDENRVRDISDEFYLRYNAILEDAEFLDLISKSVDHKSRTVKRFKLWRQQVRAGIL